MTQLIDGLITRYGLLAVFAGCLAEGETAAILGGFFAHQQLFQPWQTVLAAFFGATLGDTLFFLLGRHFAQHRLIQRWRQQPGVDRAQRLLHRHPNLFIFFNRYVYGMRLAGGIATGLAEISTRRFILLNTVSALVWAALFSALGYYVGLGAEQLLGHALHRHHRLWLALALGVTVVAAATLVRHRTVRHAQPQSPPQSPT